jgi:hypothetical protein
MGYRSEVTSCIYGKTEAMIPFLTKHKLLGSPVFPHFEDDLRVDTFESHKGEEYKILVLAVSDAKWYDGYSDVKAWDALLKAADAEDLEWEFVAVGEDGQTEERRSSESEYFIVVNHSIDIEY